jgi:integrase
MPKLTKTVADQATYQGTPTVNARGKEVFPRCALWDDELRGFGLRILPSGRKAWVLSYRAEGVKRLMKLGNYPTMGADKARSDARKKLGLVEDGTDPMEERRKARQGTTVKDLATAFLRDHVDPDGKRPGKRPATRREYRRQVEKILIPAWGTRKAASIRRADMDKLHEKVGQRAPYLANRLVALVGKLFEFGRKRGFVEEAAPNPARGIEKFQERSRKRWVKPHELPFIAAAIDQESNVYTRGALWLYLLTGARKTELLKVRWSDVDLERKEVVFQETKTGDSHELPLSEAALAIFASLPRQAGNPFVFCGAKEKEHLVNVEKPWRAIRERATMALWAQDPKVAAEVARLARQRQEQAQGEAAERPGDGRKRARPVTCQDLTNLMGADLPAGMLDVRLHDLRRTVGSWLASYGDASLPVIGRILHHTQPATTQVYARLSADPAREALESHGRRIMEKARPNGNGGDDDRPGLRVVK